MVKPKQQGRLKTLSTHLVLGASRLVELGLKSSTSLVERFNLTLRQALAPLARKSLGFCKDRTQLRRQVTFYQVFYNFAHLPRTPSNSLAALHTRYGGQFDGPCLVKPRRA